MRHFLFALRGLFADLAPSFLFMALVAVTHQPLLATGVAIAVGVGQVALALLQRRKVSSMQWMGFGLVVAMGSATLISHDARFMMLKPTIIDFAIGAVMLQPGWMLRYVSPDAMPHVSRQTMTAWGYVWAWLMFLTGVLNAGFAWFGGFAAWSAYTAIFPLGSKLALFAIQYATVNVLTRRRYAAQAQVQGEAQAQVRAPARAPA
ncbi:MAG: septation protein IspZ [Caulobacterales bacterium]|nr:septation protein IspZ [Caulobacterales bacterium]